MPQRLPDLRQRGPRPEQVGGQGVPEAVRPQPGQAGPGARAGDDRADRTRGQGTMRVPDPDEQRSAITPIPAAGQIGNDGLTNVHWQRQRLHPVTFPADRHRTRAPIHIV